MLRGLLIVSLVLSAAFSLALGVFHLAPTPATDPIEADFGGCSTPCWFGMQPGITGYFDTVSRFKSIGWQADSSFCRILSAGCTDFRWWNPNTMGQWAGVHFNAHQIDGIVVEGTGLTLGQLLQSFGAPHSASLSGVQSSRAMLYSAQWDGIGVAIVLRCPTTFAALLQQPVEAIVLSTFADSPPQAEPHSFRSVCTP